MNFDYEKDMSIDPHELDEEWMKQPALATKYAQELARVTKDVVGSAQLNFDIVVAEQDKRIRKNWEKYMEKFAETPCKNAVMQTEEYREALERLNEAKYDRDVLKAAVNGFEHRKRALEDLVKLYLGDYFSVPSTPRLLEGGKRELDGRRTDRQREGLNRKRKRKSERTEF
jgi:hypothetical protein